MTSVTPSVASFAAKAAVSVKKHLRRFVRSVVEARMRKIQDEIEFHHRLNGYRRIHDSPPLSSDDSRDRF